MLFSYPKLGEKTRPRSSSIRCSLDCGTVSLLHSPRDVCGRRHLPENLHLRTKSSSTGVDNLGNMHPALGHIPACQRHSDASIRRALLEVYEGSAPSRAAAAFAIRPRHCQHFLDAKHYRSKDASVPS